MGLHPGQGMTGQMQSSQSNLQCLQLVGAQYVSGKLASIHQWVWLDRFLPQEIPKQHKGNGIFAVHVSVHACIETCTHKLCTQCGLVLTKDGMDKHMLAVVMCGCIPCVYSSHQ